MEKLTAISNDDGETAMIAAKWIERPDRLTEVTCVSASNQIDQLEISPAL